MQETYVRAWDARGTLRDGAAALGWLCRIARNVAHDRRRSWWSRIRAPLEAAALDARPAERDRAPDAALAAAESARAVRRALARCRRSTGWCSRCARSRGCRTRRSPWRSGCRSARSSRGSTAPAPGWRAGSRTRRRTMSCRSVRRLFGARLDGRLDAAEAGAARRAPRGVRRLPRRARALGAARRGRCAPAGPTPVPARPRGARLPRRAATPARAARPRRRGSSRPPPAALAGALAAAAVWIAASSRPAARGAPPDGRAGSHSRWPSSSGWRRSRPMATDAPAEPARAPGGSRSSSSPSAPRPAPPLDRLVLSRGRGGPPRGPPSPEEMAARLTDDLELDDGAGARRPRDPRGALEGAWARCSSGSTPRRRRSGATPTRASARSSAGAARALRPAASPSTSAGAPRCGGGSAAPLPRPPDSGLGSSYKPRARAPARRLRGEAGPPR